MRRLVLAIALLVPAVALAAGTGVKQAKPWIGILLDTERPQGKGVQIKEVMDKTPAQKAGLQKLDEILAIDGVAVTKAGELIARVAEKGVGQTVSLRVLRAGKEITISLALEAKPDELKMMRDQLVGKPALPFDVPGATLASTKGQVVLLEFWATWCGPCRSSLPRLEEWQKKYGAKGLKVVGVSDEKPEVVAKFIASKPVGFTVGSDAKAKEAYRVPVIPMLVVIDRQGIVRHVEIGAGSKLDNVEQAFLAILNPK